MTLQNIIDGVAAWAQEAICTGLTLKLPDDDANDGDCPGETVTPTAFPCFLPAKDRLPPGVRAPIPSVCVQLVDGKDELVSGKRTVSMRLNLATWNPGTHGAEIMAPEADAGQLGGKKYRKYTTEQELTAYTRNMDGWRGAWAFADRALRALETSEFIAGLRLRKEAPNGITYGPYTEDGKIWEYYPYWFLWIEFDLESGPVHRAPDLYKDFL